MTIEPMTIKIAEATRIVPASAENIFELLASPAKHALIDGSGTVKGAQRGTPERLSLGARFGMNMRIGAPYKILNEVVEFEEGRRIAWRHFAGHIWRYILEPLGPNTTQVTEQFDPTDSRAPRVLKVLRWQPRNQRAIEQTLHRLVEWASNR
ncbi:MAG TPA: SRPBCC family protein [Propionibacteriaceae bacterium]|nr:SRPBCC family protein [Propionibacteriaceae bacterium]